MIRDLIDPPHIIVTSHQTEPLIDPTSIHIWNYMVWRRELSSGFRRKLYSRFSRGPVKLDARFRTVPPLSVSFRVVGDHAFRIGIVTTPSAPLVEVASLIKCAEHGCYTIG